MRCEFLQDDPELVHLQMQAGILIAVAMWITRSNVHTVQGEHLRVPYGCNDQVPAPGARMSGYTARKLHADSEMLIWALVGSNRFATGLPRLRGRTMVDSRPAGVKDGLTTQFPECDTYPHPLAESCDRSGGAMRFRHTDAAGTQFTGVVFFRHGDDHDWTGEQLSAYFLEHVSDAVYDCTRDGPVPVDTTGLARCIDDGIRYSGGRTPRSTLAVLEPPGLTVQEVVVSFNERSVLLPYHYDGLQGNQGVPPPLRLSIPNTQWGGREFLLAVVLLLPGAP